MTDGAPPKRPSLPKALQLFGEYVVDSLIEEGPTWALYKALHISNEGQRYRVRVLQGVDATRRQVIEAFARMAILLDSLKHEGIIPVANAGVDQGLVFIINAEVPGITLRQRIETGLSSLDPGEIARIVRETAAVLDYLHHHDPPILHRTLDPSRILISQPTGSVKVLEVGYAHAVAEVARVEAVPHAPSAIEGYRAPEDVVGGETTAAIDQYALAKVARACLEARRTPVLAAALRATEAVIAKATATDPSARFASAGAFATAFSEALEHASSHANAPTDQHAAAPAAPVAPPPQKISSAGIPRVTPPLVTDASKPVSPPSLRKQTIIGTPGPAMPPRPSPGTDGPVKRISGSLPVPRPGGTSSSSIAAVADPRSPNVTAPFGAAGSDGKPRDSAPLGPRDTEPSPAPVMAPVAPAPAPPAAKPPAPPPMPAAKPASPPPPSAAPNPHTSPTREAEIPLETISMVPVDEFDAVSVTSVSPPDGELIAKTHPSNPPDEPKLAAATTAAAASTADLSLPSATKTAPLYGGPPAPTPPPPNAPAMPAAFGLHDDTDQGSYPPRVNAAPPAPAPMSSSSTQPPPRVSFAPEPVRSGAPIGKIFGFMVLVGAVAAGVVYREPLMRLAAEHGLMRGETTTANPPANNPVSPNHNVALPPVSPDASAPSTAVNAAPDASIAANPIAAPAQHDAAVAAPVIHDASNAPTVAVVPQPANPVPNPIPTPANPIPTPPPANNGRPLPRRPNGQAQDAAEHQLEQGIAACNGHLGHHAYIRVIYDGATGQASTVEFTGHTLDGNPLTTCLEAAVRAVPMPPFRDEHWEKHWIFMIR